MDFLSSCNRPRVLAFVLGMLALGSIPACGGGGSSAIPGSGANATVPLISVPTATPAPQATLVYTSDQGVILSQPGQTYQFSVGVQFPAGSTMPVSNASWQSLNPSVATVDQTGKVTVTGASGSAVIAANFASYDAVYASVIVAHATPQTVQISSSLVKSASPLSAVLVRNAQTQSLLPGAIVVSGSAGGLFGQVTAVQMDSSTVTVQLQQTTIPAAFPDYSYAWNGPPLQLTVQSRPGGRYIVSTRRGRVIAEGLADVRCSTSTISVAQLPSFDVPVSVQPIFQVDLRRGFVQMGAELSGSVNFSGGSYDLAGSVDNPVECAASINLLSHLQVIVGSLLVAAPVVSPSVGIEISSTKSVKIIGPTAGMSFDVLAGVQFQSGQWSLLSNNGPPVSLGKSTPPQLSYNGAIGAHVAPYFGLDVGFNVCPFVCITSPFDNTLLNATVAFGKISSPYEISLTGTTNELAQGYRGPVFTTYTKAEAGLELNLDFGALDRLLKHLNITPLAVPFKSTAHETTHFVTPSVRAGANATKVGAGDAVTLTASASGQTASGIQFIGFLNGASTATVLGSATLDASGNAATKWTPSIAGQFQIVALLENVVGLPTASTNSVSVTVSPNTPQPTPVPPITPQPTPTPKLATVANTGGTGLNLRNAPGTSATVVTVLRDGTQTTVIGGPTVVNGYTWWNVRATVSGVQYSGWSGIGDWLAPPPAVGANVIVSYTNGIGLHLRSTPSQSGTLITSLPEGTQMGVIGGPVAADGFTWWNLRGTVSGTQYTGWSAVGDWLTPNPRY